MNRADAATPVELVRNGGFETGHPPVPWTQDRSRGRTLVATGGPDGGPAAGKYSIRLGGSNNESDRIAQEFLIPPGVAAVDLTFRYRIRHNGSGSADGDRLRVAVADVESGTERVVLDLTGADDSAGEWRVAGPVSLLPEAGRYVALSFTGTTDKDKPTSFSLDEVRAVAIPSGRASEIKLSFVNPRLGCRDVLPPRDVTASGLLPIDVVAGEDGGIAALFLELDGRRIAREHQARLHFDLDTTTLSPGPHVLEAQAITTDGRLRVCRIDITPLDILRNGNFEEALDLDNWVYSTNAAGRQPLAGGPDPLPADGILMAALGGVSRVTEKLTQSLHFPADLAAATLSYHVRIATTRNQAGVDLLRVKLRHVPLVGTPTETILATYANPTSSETGWTLEGIAIPPDTITSLAGKDVQLAFEAVNGGGMGASTASTFFVDAVALMAQSNLLVTLNAPQVELTFNPVGPALCPTASGGAVTFTATATTIASPTVDLIQVFMDGTEAQHIVAQCNSCSSIVGQPLPISDAGCHRFIAKAESEGVATWGPTLHIYFDPTPSVSGSCLLGPAPPPPGLINVPAEGEVLEGLFSLRVATAPSACLRRTEVLLEPEAQPGSGRLLTATESSLLAFDWPTSSEIGGRYRLRIRNLSPTNKTSEAVTSVFEIKPQHCWTSQRCTESAYSQHESKCQAGSDATACLRLALCASTRAFARLTPANLDLAGASLLLGKAIDAMEAMKANGGYSIFNSFPAVAIGLTLLEIENRLARTGDSRSLDSLVPRSGREGFADLSVWNRAATILLETAEEYPFALVPDGPSPEGCDGTVPFNGHDEPVGDTCAEERAGQVTALTLAEHLFPSDSLHSCRSSMLDLLKRSVLSRQSTLERCGTRYRHLRADRSLISCSLTPHLRLYNHGEENPPYAAAVLSALAATDGVARLFGGTAQFPLATEADAAQLVRWLGSKSESSYSYRQGDCLRLEWDPAACPFPDSDTHLNSENERVPDRDCDGWPVSVSCSGGCPEDYLASPPPNVLKVDCSDSCRTSSGRARQPCWNPISNFATRLFSRLGQTSPVELALFAPDPSRTRASHQDETDLFYYEFAHSLPEDHEADHEFFEEHCEPLGTVVADIERRSSRRIDVVWSSRLPPGVFEIFRRRLTSLPAESCSLDESACEWESVGKVPSSQQHRFADCDATDCDVFGYRVAFRPSASCIAAVSSEVFLDRSSPCGAPPGETCVSQPD